MLRLPFRTSRSYHAYKSIWLLQPLGYHVRVCRRSLTSHPSSEESEESEPGKKTIINYFKQLLPGSRRTRVEPAEEDEGEFAKETKALKNRIDELGAEIADLEGGNKPSLIEPLIATLSEEDQAKVRKALAEPNDEEEVDLFKNNVSLIDLPRLAGLAPRLKLSPQQAVYIQNLDKRLREAADEITSVASRRNLWKAYDLAKRTLPPFLHLVPESIFRVLWESQSNANIDDPSRAGHLCVLAADLSSTGQDLSKEQALLHIDSLLRENRLRDAQLQWESYETRLGSKDETRMEYGYLGVRIFAEFGDPERAQQIALELMPKSRKDMISPTLVPVIIAWVKRGDDKAVKSAWALYLRLRERLGSEIRVRDYDYLTLSFLNAGRPEVALAVFKDLMLSGQSSEYTSQELYKTSLGLIGKMHSQSIDAEQLNKASLTALIVMPRRFQNKYFYGSWMKHLIGIGEIDAAASVIELMIERGMRPDSKHLNGIIGAWLRGGKPEDRAKAEQMAWAMIHQRIDFVQKRQGQHVKQDHRKEEIFAGQVAPYLRRRLLARATIETFSLLLLDYGRRSAYKQANVLKTYFGKAEIPPNSYWMNHSMYSELREGRHNIAWNIYKHRPKYTVPDLETFACLWDCEKRHLDRLAVYPQDNFPNPRRLLREMLTWYGRLGKRAREDAREEATKQLYDQIIRCHCLQKDLEGTIVALYALKELFDIYPDQDTARLISLSVARVGIGGEQAGKRRRNSLSAHPQSRDAAAKMKQVLNLVYEQRAEKLLAQGIDSSEFSGERKGQEMAIVLATFLQLIMRETNDVPAIAEKIQQAALDSGSPSLERHVELITE